MSVFLTLAGGFVGFVSAILSVAVAGASLFAGLLIWTGIGIAFLMAGLAFAFLPRQAQVSPSFGEAHRL